MYLIIAFALFIMPHSVQSDKNVYVFIVNY